MPAAYFDVDAGRYVTLRSEPIPIEVSKAMRLASRDIIASGGPAAGSAKEIEARQGGIFANVTDPGQLCDDSIRPERWLAGVGGLAAAYIALAFVRRPLAASDRRHGDAAAACGRRRRPAKVARGVGRFRRRTNARGGRPRAGHRARIGGRHARSARRRHDLGRGVSATRIGRRRRGIDRPAAVAVGHLRGCALRGDCPDFRVNENGTVPFVCAQLFGRDADKLLRAGRRAPQEKETPAGPGCDSPGGSCSLAAAADRPTSRWCRSSRRPSRRSTTPASPRSSPRRPCSTRRFSIAGDCRGRCSTIRGMRGCKRANRAGPSPRTAWRGAISPAIRARRQSPLCSRRRFPHVGR